MPTRGRKEWAAQALKCLLVQTYPEKELVILDDADDPSFPDFAEPSMQIWLYERRILYFRRVDRARIDEKRNHCCNRANGQILMHFDSDDYSSPERMADQVKHLEESGKAVIGYHSMPFFDEGTQKAFLYSGHPLHAVGTSLCYTREFWQAHKFLTKMGSGGSVLECEDNGFVFAAKQAKQIATFDCGRMMVARIHKENTTAKHPHYYKPYSIDDLPKGFFS